MSEWMRRDEGQIYLPLGGKTFPHQRETRRKKSARILFVLPGTAYKSPGHEHKVINATQKKAGLQRQTLI